MKTDNSSSRIEQDLRRRAAALAPGAALPSVRALMRDMGVGPATVQRALRQLAREGVLESFPGRGTFVAAPPALATGGDTLWQTLALGPARTGAADLLALSELPPAGAFPLHAGYLPPELRATSLLDVAAARALRQPGVWDRVPATGSAALRRWFAISIGCPEHEVIVCPGTQPALAAAFQALAAPASPVLMESPTYLGALLAARAAGLVPVPVPTDGDGVRPEPLAAALRESGARLLYLQPTHANPTGASLAPARRAAVMELARRHGLFILEDDWARDFSLAAAPPPLAADDPHGHVILLRSLTKCAAPGLRVGALRAKGAAFERLRAARVAVDFFVPAPLQETALNLLTAPSWPRHLRRLQAALRARRDALAAALRQTLGEACLDRLPTGGLHLWLRLPPEADDEAVTRAAARRQVLVSPGRAWFPAEPTEPRLRLSFAAVDPADAPTVADRIAEALREA
ncbi:MAG: PLP-dependent aminotransferase family protein [Rhodospirillales bacterium]|nr:PLP-dependent aminotransferase family protein [Rhodospirillales bacterium]